jgi:hypothetical protein
LFVVCDLLFSGEAMAFRIDTTHNKQPTTNNKQPTTNNPPKQKNLSLKIRRGLRAVSVFLSFPPTGPNTGDGWDLAPNADQNMNRCRLLWRHRAQPSATLDKSDIQLWPRL